MFLGLDLGTTNVKALVIDSAGRSLARASSPVGLSHVGDAGVEQDIEEIERAALAAMRQVAQCVDPAGIAAVGISSQGGAMQVLDAQSRPVGRVISWLDQRGRPFDQAIFAELGREWFLSHIRRGCSGLAIGQLLRLRHESPELLRAPNRVGFVGDIVVSRLCGRAAHDGTSCSLTLLYNPELRSWDPELLQRLQLDPRQLPDLISPRATAGGLRADVVRETGLRAGIPVSAAIHDQYAAALGSGAVRAGTVMVGTGTAWVLLAVNDRLAAPVIDEAFVCNHVVEGLCGQILSLVNGGSSFTWALNLTGLSGKDHGEIETLLESTQPGSARTQLAGRSWSPRACRDLLREPQGRLAGLQLVASRGRCRARGDRRFGVRAESISRFPARSDWPVEQLVMGGGAAGSRITTQIIADATGVPLACLENSETSLLGAAILARGLVEARTSLAELSSAMVPPARLVEPGAETNVLPRQVRAIPGFSAAAASETHMTSTPLHFHWHYTDVDRAFWAEHLEEWLPRRIIDAHTHVADPRLRLTPMTDVMRRQYWVNEVFEPIDAPTADRCYSTVFPNREFRCVAMSVPDLGFDIDGGNRYLQVECPKAWLVQPGGHPAPMDSGRSGRAARRAELHWREALLLADQPEPRDPRRASGSQYLRFSATPHPGSRE